MLSSRLRGVVIGALVIIASSISAPSADQLAPAPFGGTAEYVADLRARRTRIADALGRESVLVLWSAPARVYSDDTDYEFRQESNLLYLTGLSRQHVIFVLVPGAVGAREFLFVPAADPVRELWTGRVPRADEVRAATGIDHVFAQTGTEAFDTFMRQLLGRPGAEPGSGDHAAAVRAGAMASPVSPTLQIALLNLEVSGRPAPPADSVEATRQAAWIRQIQGGTGTKTVTFVDATTRLRTERQIKTAYEQRVLRRSVAISAEAHVEGMKATRPGRWEFEVEAAIERWFLQSGAMSWGYPSIVGSGPNATTLHYVDSSRRMEAGDLLLVDAAGNFQGLTGDITRTYPVSRRFTPEQRALYELVLVAEEAGLAAAKPGTRAADINRAVRQALGTGLLRLGLITDPSAATGESSQIALWFPHSAVHGIGVDVHDPLGRLDPGAAFVIEPGLYIRPDTLDRLLQDPNQTGLARAIRPAVERFAGLGIRIEDSFLMTGAGPENLSSAAPRLVRDLERVVGSGRD